jgi:hypothetical protein
VLQHTLVVPAVSLQSPEQSGQLIVPTAAVTYCCTPRLPLLPAAVQGLMEDGELWLKIHWVGYDLPTWDTCDQLDAHPADYDYLSDETRQWVVLRYEALQKQQQQQQEEEEQQQQQQEQRQPRKRQLRVQQQQPQRRTRRSRSAAAGSSSNANSSSSGSSSSGYSNPLLEDGCSDHHHHVTN